jgi:hypothetical protein
MLYFVFTWLAGYSLLYGYFGSLTFMAIMIVIEEYSTRTMESETWFKKVSEQKDREKLLRSFSKGIEYNISTKTILYLFYVFVLIFSQIIENNPALAGEDLRIFILSNNHSILVLIAIDMLIGQVSKDRERMKKIAVKFKEYFPKAQENQENQENQGNEENE